VIPLAIPAATLSTTCPERSWASATVRWLAVALLVVIVLLQHPLWLGKGGWLRVWDVDRQLQEQKEANRQLEVRNAGLDAEVRDLKQGYEAIEERARFELGMVKQNEVFVQIPDKPAMARDAPPVAAKPVAAKAAARSARPARP
jgi:cell division protein FtsB